MTLFGIKKTFLLSILALLFIMVQSSSTIAQVGSGDKEKENQERPTLSLDFGISEVLGGIYYNDPLGLQLATSLLPYEGIINPETYILGPNDLLSIEVESSQPIFLRGLNVNPQGDLVLPLIGSINVNDLSIIEAQNKIQQELSSQLNNPIVNISIDNPKPSIIHVTGAVVHPGKYILPGQTRVDQAIFQAVTSGKRDITSTEFNTSELLSKSNLSFRNIQLFHKDGTESSADLIEYFRTGNLTYNPFIHNGDLIVINRLNRESPKVSISGAVTADYEVEYKKGDTPALLLRFGGGFEEVADTTKLFVYRRSIAGVDQIVVPKNEWSTFKLQPNDRVIAPFGEDVDASASAWIRGEINIPGNFPIVSGETTALELIETSGGLTDKALPSAAYLIRSGQKNAIPNQFNADLMKRTSDQVVQGLEYLDSETKLSRNRVFIDLTDNEQLNNLRIFDGDQLYVPKDEQTIFVFGQVNNPGYFGYSSTKSPSDYIAQAGGFALSANKERVFILKAGDATWFNVEDTELNSGDKIFVDRIPVEELNSKRQYEIQKQQLRNQRTQLIMTAITTITGIITTYVAVRRL